MSAQLPTPNPSPHDGTAQINAAVMKTLQSQNWKGRVLTTLALVAGLGSIVVGIALASFMSQGLFPSIRAMLHDSPPAQPWHGWPTNAVVHTNMNSTAGTAGGGITIDLGDGTTISSADPAWRHAVVTLMLGKGMFMTAVSIALLGAGTLLTLLLVIFNRRIALRQINASLVQLSNQLKQLQDSKSPPSNP